MERFIVDNIAKILPHEKSVLDVFKDRITRAINNNQQISFHIAVGFFFFEGFQKLYPFLNELYEKNLIKEFKLVMGPETRKTTKEVLQALKNDAIVLDDKTFDFIICLFRNKTIDCLPRLFSFTYEIYVCCFSTIISFNYFFIIFRKWIILLKP